MDTKKAIQTLIRIAENQQKIINKLAQIQPPPDRLEPNQPKHHMAPEAAVKMKLLPDVASAIKDLKYDSSAHNMAVSFLPNKGTDQVWKAVLTAFQQAVADGVMPNGATIKEVA